jgi:acetoin utilization deacetylase AcuC-like enzyme
MASKLALVLQIALSHSALTWARRRPMLRFRLVYHDGYFLPIGEHVFAAQKYRLVYQLLLREHAAGPGDFVCPEPATDDDVLLVHTEEYVRKLRQGRLNGREQLQLEVPYSPELVKAFWLHAGGTMYAAELALKDGISINLGGGFHHAFPDHGEGFCMINDVAIAACRLIEDNRVARVMVVDCDVHQGNGTAFIFNPVAIDAPVAPAWSGPILDPRQPQRPVSVKEAPAGDVFTVSLHQENNYPQWKPPSSMDVNLPDGVGDAEYLSWLDNALNSAFRQFEPDLLAYVAGADPYREDQLGGLALTMDGLRQRDEMVFTTARARRVPVFVTLAGGYARRVEDTVRIHANTVLAAKEVYSAGRRLRRVA